MEPSIRTNSITAFRGILDDNSQLDYYYLSDGLINVKCSCHVFVVPGHHQI
jgi:hypothetical protein